ncbi:efflux RND transporter periplasmic adaptor subunit [Desulfurivibrio alkaliphilus]|uniref:Efflux transporter, RND family, MFP subunit n=1 Tax=Desulfurivibrio alkaliphilus (strain DSM 19089 / UNIQEM U267 / AHT2) TaxID=589865 RepID=D6Z423_DESAT|nr:efflux RND transporter periplasmic adaptor subunit [Desulfurivibrio alkaliphilus]ADH86298.1 efflux transporter, RND family, MFP subunit [Desulfurivibrio alkaliphilus AHT 2]
MAKKEKIIRFVLPLLVLLAGFLLMQLLLSQRQAPEPRERVERGALVELLAVQPETHQVMVRGSGTVQPQREISLIPRVSGEVVELGPNFVAGGFVREGELLFRLDPADYELARERAKAAVARAEARLVEISERAAVARREWELFAASPDHESDTRLQPSPLALYQPQLLEAEAERVAAEADLTAARLDLERTTLLAPFNGRIRQRQLELGQFIQAGVTVATLTGTDRAEIIVPLPQADLPWLQLPRPASAPATDSGVHGVSDLGSPALVTFTAGDRDYQWPGKLHRTLGEVESQGRMVQTVIMVEDPYDLADRRDDAPALLPGMFVGVQLAGKRLEEVFILPRRAVREGDTVWLMDDEQRLRLAPVNIRRRERETAIIDHGLTAGDQVVLTELVGAVEGMLLRANNRETPREMPREMPREIQ